MEEQLNQLIQYIHQSLSQGTDRNQLYQSLLQIGWTQPMVNEAFRRLNAPLSQMDPVAGSNSQRARDVRIGVLWIVSPFIILFGTAILQVVVRYIGINGKVLNIIALLSGFAGVILLIAGPVIGIMKIVKANKTSN